MTRAEKYVEIEKLRGMGLSTQEIAEELGMRPGGIRSIINDPDGSKQKARRERYRGVCGVCGEPTTGCNGWNAPDLCRLHSASRVWTQEKVIGAIQQFAKEHGRPPRSTDWPHTDRKQGHPAATAIYGEYAAFPSWADAVEAAGFPRPSMGRGPGQPQWNRDAIIEAIQAWVSEKGETPRMWQWERTVDPAFPTNSTVVAYFGTWNEAIQAAGFTPRRGRPPSSFRKG
jgi:hypothetical protein